MFILLFGVLQSVCRDASGFAGRASSFVFIPTSGLTESSAALLAGIWFQTGVSSFMSFEVARVGESFVAALAGMWFLTGVTSFMIFRVSRSQESQIAVVTREGFHAEVSSFVCLEGAPVREPLVAALAFMWSPTSVDAYVGHQVASSLEACRTHRTAVWFFFAMNTAMISQGTPAGEAFLAVTAAIVFHSSSVEDSRLQKFPNHVLSNVGFLF